MRTTFSLLFALLCLVSFGQTQGEGEILINTLQEDDTYRAGESVKVTAPIQGDLVIAGGRLTVNDSVNGDLTAAGGELFLNGYVKDDARLAVGRATIDSEIGDDLIVFGGEVILTENAVVHGNLKCTGGTLRIQGTVMGDLIVKGKDISLDAKVSGTSKITAEEMAIGPKAQFFKDVQYYHDDGEVNFNNALVNAKADFNEDLGEDSSDLSMTTLGTKSAKMWIFYIFSAFLVILVLHALFRSAFSDAIAGIDQNWLKSFGFGLLYLIGIPIAILLAFLMIVGIPLGLFAAVVFIFSLLFGHMIAALLLAYYFRARKEKAWGFWTITFLALLIATILRVLTMVPYAGIILSIAVLAITYGALTLRVIHSKGQAVKP